MRHGLPMTRTFVPAGLAARSFQSLRCGLSTEQRCTMRAWDAKKRSRQSVVAAISVCPPPPGASLQQCHLPACPGALRCRFLVHALPRVRPPHLPHDAPTHACPEPGVSSQIPWHYAHCAGSPRVYCSD